jgi:O-glycosyl hydrolase
VATTTTLSVAPTTNVTTVTPVTLTATVSSSEGTAPTGTVTFLDSGTSIGTANLASGVATLTIAAPAAGAHNFTASYGGGAGLQSSTSSAVSLTVGSPAAMTTTALVVAPLTNVTTATPVTLTATVSSASATPPGTVTFMDGTTAVGTGTLAGGVATLMLSTLTAGAHSFTASYAGNTSFAASTSAAVALTVTTPPATTTTALVVAPTTNVTTSTPVTLTATVSSTSGTPTGTVTFLDGSTAVGTGTLGGGTATVTLPTLTAGAHSFTVSYAGNTSFAASTSAAVALTVTTAATMTALVVSPTTNVTTATPVTLTATVSSTGGTPTGSVTFIDGTTTVGTGSLTAGVATLTLSTLTAGSHSFTASYAGDSDFAASTSTAVSLTVTSASGIDAHATFSFATANQTIMGFGGAEAFYANYLDSHPNESQIMTALFDPVNGLGLSFLRLENNYYLYNGSNASTFDTDNAKIVSGATTALGATPTILMSSWTPPASLKSNNSVDGCTGVTNGNCTSGFGTLAQVGGEYNYTGFGQFWLNSLQAYAALGVVPDYISIQNEPDFPATYVGCLFNPTEAPANLYNGTQSYASYGKAFDATYQAINGGGLTSVPKMIGPESFSLYNVQALLTEVPAGELAVVAHHLYNVSSNGGNPASQVSPMTTLDADYPTQMKWETEYYQTPGFDNAIDIHNALTVANDNVYLYWALAWPSTLDAAKDQAADQQGLIYIDNPFNSSSTWAFTQGWTYNDAYYAMKHYSYYIRPGYVRYDATVDNSDERVSVYQSPDANTTIIVALNVSTTATDVLALDLSSITYMTSAMYRSTFSQPISTGERWDNLGAYDATNGVTLGPQSAVTVVLTK